MQDRQTSGTFLYAGIEAGGTKFVCGTGTGPDDLRLFPSFPTTNPQETLQQAISYLRAHRQQSPIAAIGIGSFGPLDLNPASPTYGFITNTPKPGWENTDFVGAIRQEIAVPIAFDTDVNAAALGEHEWGAAQGLDTFVYLTIGTGIGGGAFVNGQLVHGMVHPEMGHMHISHATLADPFKGICPFHTDCLEGLASGKAMGERWGQKADTLPPDHPAWELEARYLALALVNLIVILSPQRIILGGGIMQQTHLFPSIRQEVQRLLNNYVKSPQLLDDIDSYIVPPALDNRAGVLGAIALAQGL